MSRPLVTFYIGLTRHDIPAGASMDHPEVIAYLDLVKRCQDAAADNADNADQ